MDSSDRTQDTHHHYWLIALVIIAGLAITWFVADKAISGYEKRAQAAHQQQHELLRLRIQERLTTLFDSIGWVVITARGNPEIMRQSIAAFTNSYPSIISAGLVQQSEGGKSLLWEYSSALHRQASRLPLLLEETRPLSGLIDNPPISTPVIITPRITLPSGEDQMDAMGILRGAGQNQWLALVIEPRGLIRSLAGPLENTLTTVKVHDLDQHSKSPLFMETSGPAAQDQLEQRSELLVGNRSWLLSTVADAGSLAPGGRRSWQSIWLTGLTVTVLFALTCYLLGRRISMLQSGKRDALAERDELAQQLGNIRVEKSIIRQALEDCEQRSRDLVELTPDITAELDENGRIGFVSGQVADLLSQAPADLGNQPLTRLIPADHHGAFASALQAARQEPGIHQVELALLDREGQPVPATMRVLALQDTVYGCRGYRVSVRTG